MGMSIVLSYKLHNRDQWKISHVKKVQSYQKSMAKSSRNNSRFLPSTSIQMDTDISVSFFTFYYIMQTTIYQSLGIDVRVYIALLPSNIVYLKEVVSFMVHCISHQAIFLCSNGQNVRVESVHSYHGRKKQNS